MRPINSCVVSPTYQLSSYLASLLKHLYSDSGYSIMKAKEFTDFVSVQKIDTNEVIISFGVVSLFTSVPVPLGMDVAKRKHVETDEWKSRTSLTSAQILELLDLIVNNSYFKHEGDYYHQISGCAMVSPVSSAIAELVMQEIESIALATLPVAIRWWRRYVDDSNVCLRRTDVQDFHDHLNAINPNIQFTVELPFDTGKHQTIAFLDTICTVPGDGQIDVGVHRKATHTDKYLAFDSHSPLQSKAAVLKTLLDHANVIPSNDHKRKEEICKVVKDLRINGYTRKFIEVNSRTKKIQEQPQQFKGFTCIRYVKDISERVKRIMSSAGIRVAYKPVMVLADMLRKPKERPTKVETKGIVYTVKCKYCSFTYIGESKRSWN